MITAFRILVQAIEFVLAAPVRLVSFLMQAVFFNPRLGPLRYLIAAAALYGTFAVLLVYVVAPLRGYAGQAWHGQQLQYASERWLATAIYDSKGHFVGTFDPRLDSRRDVNFTGETIELAGTGYVANPDHKSIPVRQVPEYYWRCLLYHEDRRLGTWLNPYGIDLLGVLKIPVSTIQKSIRARAIRFGVGGSTLPMQLARIIYKTPPRAGEGALTKIRRKLTEWWMAPVIYHELTRGGDITPLKQWTANHLWLAQRTGGPDLHGVETTSRVVFGKPADELTTAEQFVLASAVKRPIILLEGGERLNRVRIDRWRYIVDVRARKCASTLMSDEKEKKNVWFELTQIAGGPPDPRIRPRMEQALRQYAPEYADRAEANPSLRANVLIPAARYGAREELKDEYGFNWRHYVRGVELTFDATDNRGFRERIKSKLKTLQKKYGARLAPEFSLDLAHVQSPLGSDKIMPNVIVVAADIRGNIVRYFEARDTAAYFGSPAARDPKSGHYEVKREGRAIASLGKIISAVAIANQGRDTRNTLYVDSQAPKRGLESCRRNGKLRRGRRAEVVFACSLSRPLEWRSAKLGQRPIRKLIDGFGFNMPPKNNIGEDTPPSTAAVRGLISGSPRKVHQMAGIVLNGIIGRRNKVVKLPTLIKTLERSGVESDPADGKSTTDILPSDLISPHSAGLLKTLLSAPLCHEYRGKRHGTLKRLYKWCAARRSDVRMHFAKTGTHVTNDPDAIVDAWVTGGIQFSNGRAYSYVVVVGTGSTSTPWARRLHASEVAAPLVETLLKDLSALSKTSPDLVQAVAGKG